MTISSTTNRTVAATNGATTVFPFGYYFLADADLVVLKTDTSTLGVTTLILNSDYTVTGAGVPAGGNVTISPALAAGFKITIYRDPEATQELDLVPNDSLPAEPCEAAWDKLTMIAQRTRELTQRSFRLDDGDVSGASLVVPPLQATKFVRVTADGLGFEFVDMIAGSATYSTISGTKTGTATTEAVTPDSLAAVWQEGGALTAAASIAKPASANLGGSYTVAGNTGTNTFWAGDKDGDKMWHRYTGTPLIGTSGNIVPPTGSAFQVVAGDVILWRWDSSAAKWRAYGGLRADGTAFAVAAPVTIPDKVINSYYTATGTFLTPSAATVPMDNTAPLTAETTQLSGFDQSVVTTSATQKIVTVAKGMMASSSSIRGVICLFVGGVCVDSVVSNNFAAENKTNFILRYEVVIGSATTTHVELRAGSSDGSAVKFNGDFAGALFGGAMLTELSTRVIEP